MLDNLEYFNLSINHKEELIDPKYHLIVDRTIIPFSAKETNKLVTSNEKVIRYISTLQTMLYDLNLSIDNNKVVDIINLIIEELKTKGMNYCSFCQYFNIHNMNYSVFSSLSHDKKIEVIKYIIKPYIETRHIMYLNHGYTNIVLQVMSDNYSHKRKGSYGSNKIADILKSLNIPDLTHLEHKSLDNDIYYLLSDKNGKKLFKEFIQKYKISLSGEDRNTEKYPDTLIKIKDEFYIVEQKNMKENGGGQDKQTIEITDFISKKPSIDNLHYVTFIDGIYFNQIDSNAHAKTLQQYKDITCALSKYKNNYFVNSFAFNKLLSDALNDENLKPNL